MAVARHDLRRDRFSGDAEAREDALFVVRRVARVGADRPRDRADARGGESLLEPPRVALRLEGETSQLQAEGRRLGMDAVGASDAERRGMLARSIGESVDELAGARQDDLAGRTELQRERRIEHVR